ncbi:MAG: VIT1/CCC1 transporter family protein [Candidatus Nanopelagicales bacterium]
MSGDARRFLRYLAAEREASLMYRALAETATGDQREALLELAEIEDKHAAHWESLLRDAGVPIPEGPTALDPASYDLVARAKQFSLQAVLPDLEQAERDAQGEYDHEPDALEGMADDERIHAQVLSGMINSADIGSKDSVSGQAIISTGGQQRSMEDVRDALNNAEPWHHVDKSGSLRAAVFGASDGLVSNTALVMGFAGSGIASSTVLFAGIAGLLAGAFSMAAGEYVSVASQKDLFKREIALEAQELDEKPLEEQRELELIYRAKGLDRETAKAAAEKIMSNPDIALDTLVREELGLDPDELGSPVKVAASSFIAFACGAIVPVIPYFFLTGTTALAVAVTLAAIALIVVGGTVGRLSGAGVAKSAARQLFVGAAAAAVTFVIGHLVGTGLS